MKIFSVVMAVLLAVAALLQTNDPDPFLWMAVYGAGALCSGLYTVGVRSARLFAVVSGACGLGAVYLISRIMENGVFLDETGREMIGVLEQGREMIGVLLVTGWTGFLAFWSRRTHCEIGEET